MLSAQATSENIIDKYKLDPTLHKIEIDNNKKLGKGAYGAVYFGKIDGAEAAFKTVATVGDNCMSCGDIEKEISIMAFLTDTSAPYTVKLMYHDYSNLNVSCVIGMNFAKNGSLEKYFPRLSDDKIFNIFLGLAKALAHTHHYNIVHCDIKVENVLLDADLNPLLCDFGLSKRIGVDSFGRPAGTPIFRAVELFKFSYRYFDFMTGDFEYNFTESNTKESDIYSLSMAFCQILKQVQAGSLMAGIQTYDELIDYLNAGNRIDIPGPPKCNPKIAALITLGWAQKPSDRPTAQEVVSKLEEVQLERTANNSCK